ncbi:glycoside hydrolase family 2 protein [Pseudoflavonifractor phocaeensis]|uniref:glycoside hydrolase family 2 protein n=1 Tax=Pseudoflavonifractor phocaeensis TaxID=1870988 RepID=UPI001959C672|nr:glycoside hydrolase family 2 TIM barrel-domain containing protein [Pseudoflavonifractor phocaeensis]MBM6871422.1 glycoside hydrolase family 2 protein [Pseudoflavonifractor phocaeensis]
MRTIVNLNQDWHFTGRDGKEIPVNIPHTWNNFDGQDGGNDYYRGTCHYRKTFAKPAFQAGEERVYLEFRGVNASADVELNGQRVCHHDGGYSTFRADVTDLLAEQNELRLAVDNSKNDTVYPQVADFTFYGGIYRDVLLVTVNKDHFDMDYWGSEGLKITPAVDGKDGKVQVETFHSADGAKVTVELLDAAGKRVAAGAGTNVTLTIPKVHLWDGLDDPYLYTAVARLERDGAVKDEVRARFGVRTFRMDPDKGFFLNGRSYPLRGVCRHQDRRDMGNAISKAEHQEDMDLIREIGANTIRLAHYQHDQFFYDLCDEYGLVVWAEIPYISSHMNNGRQNTFDQMRELIVQNYNHPCIVTWGLSNEITISTKDKADMLDNHRKLNDFCHKMDPTRPTTLACYAMCGPFNKVAHISDIVSWNLYLGWYVPGLKLNDLWMEFFHWKYPNRCLGYSEYGAEAMTNLHSSKPKRGDHTEEYQAIYHEYMLECFERHPFLWATHVWNMYDFAADARDQGGEPGMNHKGLVTFDRKIKKDSFFIYKAWWSDEPFVHLCGSRYVDRPEEVTEVKVYSNQPKVALYHNGKLVGEQTGKRIFKFRVTLEGENNLEAVAGDCRDTSFIRKVDAPNPAYTLQKGKSKSQNWV